MCIRDRLTRICVKSYVSKTAQRSEKQNWGGGRCVLAQTSSLECSVQVTWKNSIVKPPDAQSLVNSPGLYGSVTKFLCRHSSAYRIQLSFNGICLGNVRLRLLVNLQILDQAIVGKDKDRNLGLLHRSFHQRFFWCSDVTVWHPVRKVTFDLR